MLTVEHRLRFGTMRGRTLFTVHHRLSLGGIWVDVHPDAWLSSNSPRSRNGDIKSSESHTTHCTSSSVKDGKTFHDILHPHLNKNSSHRIHWYPPGLHAAGHWDHSHGGAILCGASSILASKFRSEISGWWNHFWHCWCFDFGKILYDIFFSIRTQLFSATAKFGRKFSVHHAFSL